MQKILIGQGHPLLAQSLADRLQGQVIPTTLTLDSQGELLLSFDTHQLTHQDVVIIQSLIPPLHNCLMEVFLLTHAAKSAQARSITLVLPYYAYGRQDHPTLDCTGTAAALLPSLFKAAGADRLITVDVHQPSLFKDSSLSIKFLSAVPKFTETLSSCISNTVIIAPDQGAVERAKNMASQLQVPLVCLNKKRGKRKITFDLVSGYVQGKTCYLVDDILDSGRTICSAADFLKKHGAQSVQAFVTHGLFAKGSMQRIQKSFLSSLTVSNSVPPPKSCSSKVHWLDITSLLAKSLYLSK